jgi:hypothetical protein
LNYSQYRNSALTNPIKDIAKKEDGKKREDGIKINKIPNKEAKF